MFRGALVYKEGESQSIEPGIPGIVPITFNKVLYDTDGFWHADQGRFVIPAGVNFVRLSAQAIFKYGDEPWSGGVRQIVIKKNFDTLDGWYDGRPGWAAGQVSPHVATTVDVNVTGPVLPVQPGDTFVVDAFVWDAREILLRPVEIMGINGTWFAIEAVG